MATKAETAVLKAARWQLRLMEKCDPRNTGEHIPSGSSASWRPSETRALNSPTAEIEHKATHSRYDVRTSNLGE